MGLLAMLAASLSANARYSIYPIQLCCVGFTTL